MSMTAAHDELAPHSELSLRDYLQIVHRRRAVFIQVFVLVLAIGIVTTVLQRPVYMTRTKLAIPPSAPFLNINDPKDPFGAVFEKMAPDSATTQIEIMQSGLFLEEAKKRAKVEPRPGIVAPRVTISSDDDPHIIEIVVEGGDPGEIARLAEAVVALHLEQTNQAQKTGVEETLSFVRSERLKAANDLNRAQNALIQFRRDHQVVKLGIEQESNLREYVELEARVREAESNVTSTQAQIADLESRLDREPPNLAQENVIRNPRIAKLRDRLDDLELQRVELIQKYKPTTRVVQDVDEQIAALRAQLEKEPQELRETIHIPNPKRLPLQTRLAELQADLEGHRAALNAARAKFEARRGVVNDPGAWEVQLARLNQDLEASQSAYKMLSEKERDLEIRNHTNPRVARVIEKASIPTTPVRPKKATNIAVAAVLALFLATGLAFLQEFLDDRVNSPEDVERVTSLPTLGHVPMIGTDQPRLVSSLPANSHVAESYRALRSSISFAGIDAPIRRLQITSASKGEGKTVTSVNLATAMAMDGKKVILVDADLRRPSIHRLLNLSNTPGLSEVLVGMKTIDEAIQETDVENLRVVCAGPIPPNPAELLGSRAFDHFVEQLEERADVILFDSAPCIPVTDPLIVAGRMDGVVLVLHVGQTKKAAIRHVQELLRRARARVVGVVFNRVQQNRGGYYYYHYYYYYGDGYYSDAAKRGERHRRNGKRHAGLGAGNEITPAGSRSGKEDA